jgi:predicted membrane-bound dolichyl-phosphate-mannose-protein mannosyltransferase
MNSNRALLFMQILTVVPLVVFLVIYADGMAYSLLAFFLLLALVINIYFLIKNKPIKSYPLVFLLMGSFYLYAFYGLGSTQTPQTFHTLKDGQSVTLFEFEKPEQIDKVCYYVGIDKNVNFTLEYQRDKRWKKFYTYEKSYPYSFRWKCINHRVKTEKMLLRVTKNQMMLGEVRFSHQNKNIPYQTKKNYLNDEANLSVDTSYYAGMFFDEIYFGRTAYEIMHNIPVYENTHPYLGKHLIIPGIKLFGMTPFGWRFMNVLFAGLLIFMAYYFGLHLFKKQEYGFISAFLMTYSFMHLSQARVGLIDTFGVLFVFISYFYLYRFIVQQQLSRLLISGVFFGLAASVKWSAVFAALGFLFIALYLLLSRYPLQKRFSGYRLLMYGVLSYGLIAFTVYAFSFFDIYGHTHSVQSIINYNTNMYNYHSTLQATHPYSSPWWSWPLDMKPMGYYKEMKHGLLSSINAFGNPALFWLGIVAVLYLLLIAFMRKSLEATFILLAFLGLYLPYVFVGRLMFIYHFYYAIPFLILAIVYMLKDAMERFSFIRHFYGIYLLIVSGLFLAFYPVLSGYVIPQSHVSQWLKWFSTWWF